MRPWTVCLFSRNHSHRRVEPLIADADGTGAAPVKGHRGPTGVNNDPMRQPDEKLRALNMQPSTDGPREQVYCTKVGSTRPQEMYIIGAHMDGIGYGAAVNDDASGTALVMELARIFSEIGDMIADVLDGLKASGHDDNGEVEAAVRARVRELCARFPIYQDL